MIEQVIYLDDYDWLLKIFFIESDYHADRILSELEAIDCEPEAFYRVAEMLETEEVDSGFTYTDAKLHVTFILIGKSTSCAEFLSTLVHEIGHVSFHLSEYYNINPYSETIQYLSGNIAKELYKCAKVFLCEKCSMFK